MQQGFTLEQLIRHWKYTGEQSDEIIRLLTQSLGERRAAIEQITERRISKTIDSFDWLAMAHYVSVKFIK